MAGPDGARCRAAVCGIKPRGTHVELVQRGEGSDPSGPLAGVPYDGVMSKADGKGLWWEGLDPQDLYAKYHTRGEGPVDKAYSEKYFNRIVELIDKHDPDILYFDDAVMPLYPQTDIGPRIAAYLYNKSIQRHGKLDAVMTGKNLDAQHGKAIVLDRERRRRRRRRERPLANRHLYRRMALSSQRVRPASLQDAVTVRADAHRHRQQKRQLDAEYSAAWQRHA